MSYVPDVAYSNAMLYGETSPRMRDFLREKTQQLQDYARERGYAIMDRVRDGWDRYHSSAALRRERAILERAGDTYYTRDSVRELYTLTEIQQASPTMQRYILADHYVKRRFEDQRTEGYGGDYHDIDPGRYGNDNYHYRRMNDGLVEVSEEGYRFSEYYEILKGDDRRLYPDEVTAISRTLTRVRAIMAKGEEDPLSKTGGWL